MVYVWSGCCGLAAAYWCQRKLALIRSISPIGCGLTTVNRWFHSLWIPARGLIEKIDFEQAEKLIMQMPCNLSSLQNKEYLVDQVNRVLQRGCEMRIWGIFESPSSVESVGGWKEWQSYFSSTGNRLMADFVGKAIRFTNPR